MLFINTGPGLRKLQKQSRADLRAKARAAYWAQQQQQLANGNQPSN